MRGCGHLWDALDLLYRRFEEGSLEGDPLDDYGPDDPLPIQHVVADAIDRKRLGVIR